MHTLNKKFSPDEQSAFTARFEAQKIVFGPVVFQCVRYAWKRGMLETLSTSGNTGMTIKEMESTGQWSSYSLKVVLETCLSAGVVFLHDGRYALDKTGFCILRDKMTQVNLDFVHDVCYQGLYQLEESLDNEKPEGLQSLGEWPTLYEGLSTFPEPARTSWLTFDHYYSDTSFPEILPDVFMSSPQRIMDIGANTGKFSRSILSENETVHLYLLDLPQQLELAKATLVAANLEKRAHFYPVNLLNEQAVFPAKMDVIWMSQLLSCFSEETIASIFKRAAEALATNGCLLVMDTFWDRQQYDIASYCLINTSPYFTAIASGNSKIYESCDYIRLAHDAGLALASIRDNIGFCHSLLRFIKKVEA